MKSFFLVLALGITSYAGYGQGMFDKAKGMASQAQTSLQSADPATVTKVTDQIMAKLGPALKLTDAQKKSVNDAVTGFIKNKQTNAPLAATDKPSYDAKTTQNKTDLMTKMKSYLTKDQLSKFMKMKPKAGDKTNPLSSLF